MPSADSAGKRLTRDALLVALALALSYLERLLPLQAVLLPLPGVKLGLANVVTLYALCRFSLPETLGIVLCRCLLGALFGGGITGLLFSLLGGILAALTMKLTIRRLGQAFSLLGVSILGAAAHHVGQILAAMLTLASWAPLAYLPALLLSALAMGSVTACLTAGVLRRLPEESTQPPSG